MFFPIGFYKILSVKYIQTQARAHGNNRFFYAQSCTEVSSAPRGKSFSSQVRNLFSSVSYFRLLAWQVQCQKAFQWAELWMILASWK